MPLFREINFNLSGLVESIANGEIGLPDLQRPFVWPNKKVRDLFDSMYRGYPVGYLLLWESGIQDHTRAIGTDQKSRTPHLLVIDGQQRLTSLYAVLKGIPVKRESFAEERIQIAFRPLDERFEVCDAAIRKDPTWIPDISALWADDVDLFDMVYEYLGALPQAVDSDEKRRIQKAITGLSGLTSFPFTALQLSSDLDEEQVAEVFVRINSKGKPLNQADFILTLMSVFQDEQRRALEDFCRASRTPSVKEASPFNHFLQPDPDHLLRVSVGLGFRRARLQSVYAILRGRDIESGEVSEERRASQFAVLGQAQEAALDLSHWHEFLKVLQDAGYRSRKYVSSRNAILFTYVFFLIGKRDLGMPYKELASIISRWFFFVALTGRYTDSPESRMEVDLADLRGVEDSAAFVERLDRNIRSTFTRDYWEITLPDELGTSSARSPGLFAYYASLVLLDAEVLFSRRKVALLFDPALHGPRSALERHHLFPKAYLKRQGIIAVRDTNQAANYALVEWPDNAEVADNPPEAYFPTLWERVSSDRRERQAFWHALPEGWETMTYREFLRERRKRIADVIRAGFEALSQGTALGTRSVEPSVTDHQPPEASLYERTLALLDQTVRSVAEPLLQESLESPDAWAPEVERYLDRVRRSSETEPQRVAAARRVADRLITLAESLSEEDSAEHQQLVQMAVRYFVMEDDARDDWGADGFMDDEDVVAAVEAALEWPI